MPSTTGFRVVGNPDKQENLLKAKLRADAEEDP